MTITAHVKDMARNDISTLAFLSITANGQVYVEAGSYGLHIHVVMGSLFAVAFKK